MYVLVAYDINTETAEGRRRLRQVAKTCLNYGQRVQNSIFECSVDEGEFRRLKYELKKIIDSELDNLRFYRLGKNYKNSIETMGEDRSYDVEGPLII